MSKKIKIVNHEFDYVYLNENEYNFLNIYLTNDSYIEIMIKNKYISYYISLIEDLIKNENITKTIDTSYEPIEDPKQYRNLIITKNKCYLNYENFKNFKKNNTYSVASNSEFLTSEFFEILKELKFRNKINEIKNLDPNLKFYEEIIWNLNQQIDKETKKKFLGLF